VIDASVAESGSDMERGAGSSSAKRRGKGASSLGTSPPPTMRGRAGTDRGPSVLQEVRDVQVLLGIERDRRRLGVVRGREHVHVVVGVVGEDRRQSILASPGANRLLQ